MTGLDYLLIRSSSLLSLCILDVVRLKVNVFDIKSGYKLTLLLRCILGGIGMPSYFTGLKYIPATKATLILNVSPLIVAIMAFYFLHEKITKLSILALIGSFIGVVLFSLHKSDSSDDFKYYYFGIFLCS